MLTSQVGSEGDKDLREKRTSCFHPIIRGDRITAVPCNKLSCPDCRHHRRHRDAERLAEKIGEDKLYLYQVKTRAWTRQVVRKLGGEYVFFPQSHGLFMLTNVKVGGAGEVLEGNTEEIVFDLFMSTPPGRRVTTSDGWHFTPLRPNSLQETPEGQEAVPVYSCRVSWDEFVRISEEHGFTLRLVSEHDGGRHYILEGLQGADLLTEWMWAQAIGRYEVGAREDR